MTISSDVFIGYCFLAALVGFFVGIPLAFSLMLAGGGVGVLASLSGGAAYGVGFAIWFATPMIATLLTGSVLGIAYLFNRTDTNSQQPLFPLTSAQPHALTPTAAQPPIAPTRTVSVAPARFQSRQLTAAEEEEARNALIEEVFAAATSHQGSYPAQPRGRT